MRELKHRRWGSVLLQSACALLVCLPAFTLPSHAADSVEVQLQTREAAPRTVEGPTERAILRDYRFAWISLTRAFQSNRLDLLEGPFSGEARRWLTDTVREQQGSGLSRRYGPQTHKLEAVFYAPEGDLMELHDTAQYHVEFLDAGKVIGNRDVVRHFVVLMTPGADRWVIRQLQAVSQF